jgi:CPA2 family monovalent cation:H+ antiporter-2
MPLVRGRAGFSPPRVARQNGGLKSALPTRLEVKPLHPTLALADFPTISLTPLAHLRAGCQHGRVHEINLITTIAFGLTAALIFGLLAKRIGLSPIVGYLVAGMVIGPHTPGFVGDVALAKQLAEIGVILLMFGVGLHFHLDDLMKVRSIAIPGALGQSALATVCALGVAVALGWSVATGTVLGIAVSVASTVVLLRVLMDHGLVETPEGQVAVGWLVVEDIITVLVLVLLPALAPDETGGGTGVWASAGIAVLKLAALGAVMAFVGAKFVPWLLLRVTRLKSRELFTLTVLVIAMAVATVGYIAFGASMALGAFLAGMVVGQSKVSHQAAADALPMRDAFAVLFFVSVGMLFDVRELFHEPWLLIGLLIVVLIVKPLVALGIVVLTGHSLRTGLTVAAGLAQIGEFSFIVAETARLLKLMPDSGHHALVACAIISISLNPWLFKHLLELEPWLKRHPRVYAVLNRRIEKLGRATNETAIAALAATESTRVIVVGYGPVGRTVARRIEEFGLRPLVIDFNIDTVLALQAEGKEALYGDAAQGTILRDAGVQKAPFIVVSLPDGAANVAIVSQARSLNPQITVLTRSRYMKSGGALEDAGASAIVYDEAEAATALAVVLRAHLKATGATARKAGAA